MTSPGKEQMTTGLDVEELERRARAATQGPWGWFGNAGSQSIYLATVNRGRQFVMKFARWGMRGSQPRFQVNGRMTNASELMEFEVCRAIGDAAAKKDPDCYRLDVTGIAHPDAVHISTFSPEVVLSLIARMKAAEAILELAAKLPLSLEALVAVRVKAKEHVHQYRKLPSLDGVRAARMRPAHPDQAGD